MDTRLEKVVSGFIRYLKSQKLDAFLPQIISLLQNHISLTQNLITVESAFSLSASTKTQLEKILTQKFGDSIYITYAIKPAILGGLVVRYGNHQLDLSLLGKIQNIYDQV